VHLQYRLLATATIGYMIKLRNVGKHSAANGLAVRFLLVGLALMLASCGNSTDDAKALAPLWTANLSDLDDKPVALETFRGRPLIVNFWARWCPPCRDEIPDFVSARARFQDRGIVVLGIAIEDKAEPVRNFAETFGMEYAVLLAKDQGLALMVSLGNNQAALPFTVAIDRQGNMVARKVGRMSRTEIETAMAAAIQ
jgi:peroxiredoxin